MKPIREIYTLTGQDYNEDSYWQVSIVRELVTVNNWNPNKNLIKFENECFLTNSYRTPKEHIKVLHEVIQELEKLDKLFNPTGVE